MAATRLRARFPRWPIRPRPRAGENFPDEPASGDVGREQDQPDLDAFAERLGLRGDETPDASNDEQVASEPSGASAVGDQARRVGSSVASTVASGLANLADRVGRLARRLDPDDHS